MKTPSMSSASRRLLRRHTDSDALDGGKSRRSSRKGFIRRPRLLTTTRSLSRFSTYSSRGDSSADDLPGVAEEGSDSASTCISTVEESSFSDDTNIVASTLVDIEEHVAVAKADEEVQLRDIGAVEDDSCENVFLKMLDMLQCFPHDQLELEEKPCEAVAEEANVDFDSNIMKIELILKQTMNEEYDEGETSLPTDTSQNETSREMILPPPSEWIQEPLLLVATPGSGMRIRRIRWVSDPSYFDSPNTIGQVGMLDNNKTIQLPINNGKEQPMHSWVIDFETRVFAGTALFRIRDAAAWKPQKDADDDCNSTNCDYFAKLNRKFQTVIRGKFKPNVVMADCMSGLLLDHHLATFQPPPIDCADAIPCSSEIYTPDKVDTKNNSKRLHKLRRGKSSNDDSLPPKWALRAAVKVACAFSPRMDANLECAHPRILSPLCSTAQTISVSRQNSGGISTQIHETHEEPCPNSVSSLVNDLKVSLSRKKNSSTSTNRVQRRKQAFDAAYDARAESLGKRSTQESASPCFDTDAEYTFEFLQHLIDYNDLSLDLGKVLGKVRLGGALRGQPVRIIAAAVKQRSSITKSHTLNMDDLDCLWSFDMWHRSITNVV
jgi:hypothetical protein